MGRPTHLVGPLGPADGKKKVGQDHYFFCVYRTRRKRTYPMTSVNWILSDRKVIRAQISICGYYSRPSDCEQLKNMESILHLNQSTQKKKS